MELETDSATVGGWVTEMLEKIPEEKDSFTYQSLTVTVTKADERRAV
ncbi:MAG: transporter associated domain-containing protein [Clostridia bacterium]|nr:transporter associated domain-containing protein [Clostridia bacterium]